MGEKIIKSVIKSLNISDSFPKNIKSKNHLKIFEYLITRRIERQTSILSSFNEVNKSTFSITTKKDSFYDVLTKVYQNKDAIFKNLNINIKRITNHTDNRIYFDSTTIYFESFDKDGIRQSGFSKDGKFKEDQIVLAISML
ncbi:hypothetical protein ACR82Z_03810 [Mycoplasma sp. 6243]|uniref:hypothetical protein n=1 Tax=Mycoplasma sp. 6243 TaxID=3440865 RepID=UPI003EB8F90E